MFKDQCFTFDSLRHIFVQRGNVCFVQHGKKEKLAIILGRVWDKSDHGATGDNVLVVQVLLSLLTSLGDTIRHREEQT